MGNILLFLGIIVLMVALNVNGFFLKVFLWACSLGLFLYALPLTEWMDDIAGDEKIPFSLFFTGIFNVAGSITTYKIFGKEFNEVSDIVINVLGYVLIVVGLCMACF